jgi:Tfp pilus assembly protein PilF
MSFPERNVRRLMMREPEKSFSGTIIHVHTPFLRDRRGRMSETETRTPLFQRPAVHLTLIALMSLLVYSNTFQAPFQFDDEFVIKNNRITQDLGLFISPSEAKAFTGHFEYPAFKMRYITYLTFALNYRMHGLHVAGYHILSLFIHTGNGILVYLFLLLTLRTPFLKNSFSGDRRLFALFIALVFACHPLQSQAVIYTWQRGVLLAAFFSLLALFTYGRGRLLAVRSHGSGSRALALYLVSLACTAAAMKTKELAITLPVLICCYEFLFFDGPIKRRIAFLFPFLATMLIVPISFAGTDRLLEGLLGGMDDEMRQYTTAALTREEYLFTQFRVILTYLRLLFFPVNQSFDYDYPVFPSFFIPPVMLSFSVLLVVFFLGVFLLSRYRTSHPTTRLISFGIFWFFITLSTESSVIPIIDVMMEYRMYLPAVGAFIACAASASQAMKLWRFRGKATRKAIVSVCIAIAAFFSMASYAHHGLYESRIRLWEDAVRKAPGKARTNYNLGHAYDEGERLEEAAEHYRRTITLDPSHDKARNNLGRIYHKMGLYSQAVEQFMSALELQPEDVSVRINLGHTYLALRKPYEALQQLNTALRLDPSYPQLHSGLGDAYLQKNMPQEAIKHFERSLKIDAERPAPFFGLGETYRASGEQEKAIPYYRKACAMGHGKSCGILILMGAAPRN